MGQLAGQRGSFRAGQRGAADGAAGRARSKLDSHLPQPTALSPARLLRCTATWLRKKKPLPSKTHSNNGGLALGRLGCFRGLSIDPLRPTGVHPVRGGSCAAAGPAEAGCVACLRGVASRAPRYALARAPARGMQGLSAGESASLLSDWGSEDRGERGRRRHPRGCRAPWPRRSPPPTRGCRRWARRISPSRSLSRSCLLTPRAQVRPSPGAGTRAAHRQNQRLPCGRLAPTTAADVPSYPIAAEPLALPRILRPNARRVAGGAPAARGWGQRCVCRRAACGTGGSRCPRRPSR